MKDKKNTQNSNSTRETESLEEDNTSIPKKDRGGLYLFLFFLFLMIALGVGYYYFFLYQTNDYADLSPNASIKEKLNYNPNYLQEENLLIIKGQSTIEYLRTRLLYHKYESKGDPVKNLLEELSRDFNGERAQVLSDILKNYVKYIEEKDKLESDKSISDYKKIAINKEKRIELFGEQIEALLFPEKPEDKLETFYLYSKFYLKNHFEDDPLSKRDHLTKARKEIYGEDYRDLILKEPIPQQIEIELGIQEREMSILTEAERKMKIESIREKFRKDY